MALRRNRERSLGRRGVRSMTRLMPKFVDLDLGLSAEDLVDDLSPGLPGDGRHRTGR